MTSYADHMTIAEIIHDFATTRGNLTDRGARDDLAAILERRMAAERAGVLRDAATTLGQGSTMRWLYERESCDWWGDRPVADWLRERADREAS